MTPALLALAALALSQDPEAPIMAGARPIESAADVRFREAVAYANPLPRGAPGADYPLVAWCEALVLGHVRLGESLNTADELDLDIMRLGRLEAADFRGALIAGEARQTPAMLDAARVAAAEASAKWTPLMRLETDQRSQAFGLFFGLPGRCEHAARRVRENITTPPATPEEVGIEEEAAPAGPAPAPVQ